MEYEKLDVICEKFGFKMCPFWIQSYNIYIEFIWYIYIIWIQGDLWEEYESHILTSYDIYIEFIWYMYVEFVRFSQITLNSYNIYTSYEFNRVRIILNLWDFDIYMYLYNLSFSGLRVKKMMMMIISCHSPKSL